MQSVFVGKTAEIRKLKAELEKKLEVKINILRGKVSFTSSSLKEFDALKVFDAIAFGFSVRKALLLKDDDFVFKKIHLREYTKRGLKSVLSRLIGRRGKTRRVISDISDCEVLIKEADVGIICDVENMGNVETAIKNLIKGSKQSNVYRYLERMNRAKKEEDLGLRLR